MRAFGGTDMFVNKDGKLCCKGIYEGISGIVGEV